MKDEVITIGLVDDHRLFSKSLSMLLASFKNCKVVVEAINGQDLKAKIIVLETPPHIMLIDVAMPIMNGAETARWLSQNYPAIKLVALSVSNEEQTIINMLRAGCCCYLFKDTHPDELEIALRQVATRGYYNSEAERMSFKRLLSPEYAFHTEITLTEKETQFLQLACSDLTYKEISSRMGIVERTVDGYRQILFQKLGVQSRTGMAMEAIRKGLVKLN